MTQNYVFLYIHSITLCLRKVIIFGELFGKVMVIKLVALAKPKSHKRTQAKINYCTLIRARNTHLSQKKKKARNTHIEGTNIFTSVRVLINSLLFFLAH